MYFEWNSKLTMDELSGVELCLDGWSFLASCTEEESEDCSQSISVPEGCSFEVSASLSMDETFLLTFDSGERFFISFPERTITVVRQPGAASSELLSHLLLDQVIPRVLAHQGSLVLHASAVDTEVGAVLFMGTTGLGKSTLAASLARSGCRLLGDDAILVTLGSGGVCGQATYPSLRLREDSLLELFPDLTPVEAQFPSWRKTSVELGSHLLSDGSPCHVRAFVLLQVGTEGQDPVLRSLSSSETCLGLIEHSFWLVPHDLERAKAKLQASAQVAGEVRGFGLSYERNFGALDELGSFLLKALVESQT